MTQYQVRERVRSDDDVAALVEERLLVALHEIRQPLAAVLALAEAAGGAGDVPDTARRYLDQIIEQVQEVSGVAWSILDARPRGGTAPEPPPLELDDLLDSVLRAVAVTWRGSLVRQGDVGALVPGGHRVRMRRCLLNVVENAVRAAGRQGRVVVTVRRDPGWVRVVVEDDGPGFGHVPTSTGMGLPVTRQCLRIIGGSLSISTRSSLGGARVALTFPAARADAPGGTAALLPADPFSPREGGVA